MSLSIHSLSFSYEKMWILEDLELEVPKGTFLGIFGPNGGGKTTFLKLLIGLLQPNQGTILLNGEAPKQRLKQIGYVPQAHRFDRQFPITVLEVVLQGALSSLTWLGSFPSRVVERAREKLALVGMMHKERASFGTLSGGEMQRVLIARALLCEPDFLFLDEATANVDIETQKQILALLLSLKGKMTILMVSHDLQMIVNEADRLVCINRRLTPYKREEMCRHFSIGLYHPKERND